ncbi:MAG TPA: hypothetical protein VGR02_21475 [Thermoanaerobaculia bacterium]|jgi:hypothetical protein|nr:hypothetical protein [Thermoanaerobaculia bacterium]
MSLLLLLWLSVVPQGVILVKGATPSASDASTPVPEGGQVSSGRYRNAYFGLTYPIPAGWREQPAGPPPSDGGSYVLAQFAVPRANVLLAAQDLFFSLQPLAGADQLVATVRRGLPDRYQIEPGPAEVMIAGRRFHRLAYASPGSGLHWRILATDARCHALTFTFTGTDPAALDAAERAMSALSLAPAAPACVTGYAQGENIVKKTEPLLTGHRFNSIPLRIVVGSDGRVKHVHLLSAFPEQSQAIIAALRTWRLEPYRVDGKAVPVETGLLFGAPMRVPR